MTAGMEIHRHDLPRCPLCGAWPADAGEYYTCCVTPGCPMSKAGCIEIETWCDRPIEREYEADLQHAREAYQDQARTIAQVRMNWPTLRDIIDAATERGQE